MLSRASKQQISFSYGGVAYLIENKSSKLHMRLGELIITVTNTVTQQTLAFSMLKNSKKITSYAGDVTLIPAAIYFVGSVLFKKLLEV